MSKLTRQGVRDLDAIGPKPKRGHVGTKKPPRDVDECGHLWELRQGNDVLVWRVCRLCGRSQ